MNGLLFNVPEQLSPRLKRKLAHKVETKDTGDEFKDAEDEMTGEPLLRWAAWTGYAEDAINHGRFETGATEDDALAALARKMGWKMWFETTDATGRPTT